jgi:hypothetical protein
MKLEKLAKKPFLLAPLLVILATGCHKKINIPLPNFELMQDAYCEVEVREDYSPVEYRVYFAAIYHPKTEENAKKMPEFWYWYSVHETYEQADKDCKKYNALVKKKWAEYKKNKEKAGK